MGVGDKRKLVGVRSDVGMRSALRQAGRQVVKENGGRGFEGGILLFLSWWWAVCVCGLGVWCEGEVLRLTQSLLSSLQLH